MRITVAGKNLLCNSITLVESLDNFTSTIEVFTDQSIGKENYTLVDGNNELPLHVESVTAQGSGSLVVFTTQLYNNLRNSNFEAFYGESTVENLLQTIGIEFRSSFSTQSSFWNIPKCKLHTLIDHLNKYAVISNGGGARFYIDIVGRLNMCDLKKAYNTTAEVKLYGTLIDAEINESWKGNYSGEIELTKYTFNNETTTTLVLEQGFGKGSYRINVTDNNAINLPEQRLKNEFYRKYFTTHIIKLDVQASFVVFLGQPIQYKNDNSYNTFIVYESRRTIDDHNNQTLKLTIVSCPNLSRQQ